MRAVLNRQVEGRLVGKRKQRELKVGVLSKGKGLEWTERREGKIT